MKYEIVNYFKIANNNLFHFIVEFDKKEIFIVRSTM